MISLRFVSQWHPLIGFVSALLLAACAWWLYRRELRRLQLGTASWLLPTIRAIAIFLIVLTLVEPIIESRHREGEPGRILFLLDGSQSMSVVDARPVATGSPAAPADYAWDSSRLERAAQHLVDPKDGVLSQLSSDFEISARRFTGEIDLKSGPASQAQADVQLWQSNWASEQELPASPSQWLPAEWGERSAIGDALSQVIAFAEDAEQSSSSVAVLMSDGQSNAGTSPLAIADGLATAGMPVFVVGYGPAQEPPDLALTAVNAPRRVYRSDVLRGTLVVADRLQPGTPYTAEILHAGQVVWQAELIAEGDPRREIAFSLPIAASYDAEVEQLPRGVEYAMLPLQFEARIRSKSDELNLQNNNRQIHVGVASQKSRILLVDGRSRWETRYLRNVFSRDPAWEIDAVIAMPESTQTDVAELPQTREEMLKYNLVILGDVDPQLWRPEQLNWLREMVERGGGLIMIDGGRQHLREEGYQPLRSLLPIRWTAASSDANQPAEPRLAQLASAGNALEALQLVSNENGQNAELWRQLPSLQFVSRVEALPGSEVLVHAVTSTLAGSAAAANTAVADPDSQLAEPLIVTRRFGAGRVLFLATDETWRWRYKVADLVHQRFWNQLARWVMRVPMSVQGEFVSLDTGAASINAGQTVEVRCSLRELPGNQSGDSAVTAIVERDGLVVTRLPLLKDDDLPGVYTAELGGLAAGDYQVHIEAAGYAREALEVESRFSVIAPDSDEMLKTSQNAPLLQQIARKTGGEYLAEQDIGRLVDLLKPISGGRITQSATILWQSYWWFTVALLLLVAEWILRKRVGLI